MRLTPEQQRKVTSLMEDESETHRAAVAWVLAFEPAKCAVCAAELDEKGRCRTAECPRFEAER